MNQDDVRKKIAAMSEQQKSAMADMLFADAEKIANAAPRMLAESLYRETRMLNTNYTPESGFDLVREIERRKALAAQQREERETLKLSKILDQDTLFRFAYVPFVIAELVWDYADTIIDLSITMRLKATKKLCRAIRELRRDYDRVRAPFIDDAHRNSETENMYMFEDGVNDIFKTLLVNIRCDLKSEYPELAPDYIDLLTAVYQCDILLHSLFRYVRMQTEKIEKIVGHRIGRILPDETYRLDALVIAFVGDKPVSERFISIKETYIKTLATQMALIELNEI